MLARIAQVSDYYAQAGVVLEGGTLLCGTVMGSKLEGLVLPGGWELEDYFEQESSYILSLYPEDDWLLGQLRDVRGLTAATPLGQEEVDIRWALQMIDCVPESEAVTVAAQLTGR